MSVYTFLQLAYDVLKGHDKPLTADEIWTVATKTGLVRKLRKTGKTPWSTLGARLFVDVRDNPATSRLIKVGKRPARFFLKERESELPQDAIVKLEQEEVATAVESDSKSKFHERDLHPLITYFVNSSQKFNRGRSIQTKTIRHEGSTKPGYSEWTYPDMVGFYMPTKDDWEDDVIEFHRLCDSSSLRLFSFELKKALNKGNYREAYFQAVSNSSWAHEGYLVAADIKQDDDFLSELERLASAFGIGILHLDLTDIDASTILYPARRRDILDWDTVNKLCEQNRDFKKFLQDVKIDFESKRVYRAEYDEAPHDISRYIAEKLKITPKA